MNLNSLPRLAGASLAALVIAIPALADDRLDLGREVFLERSEPQCSICHTLADAGAEGEVGPILDQLRPDYDRVYKAVTEGIGPMPENEVLTEEEIDAVAFYISTVAGRQ